MNKLVIAFTILFFISLTSCIGTRYAENYGDEPDDLYYTPQDEVRYDMTLRSDDDVYYDAPDQGQTQFEDDYYDPNAAVDQGNTNAWNQNNVSPNFQDPFFTPTAFRFGVNYNSWFFRWHPTYMGYGYGHYYPFNSPFYGAGPNNMMCSPWYHDPFFSPYYYSPGTLWANNQMNYWWIYNQGFNNGWNNAWNNGWYGGMDGNSLFHQNRHFGHRQSSGVSYANNSTYGNLSRPERPRDLQVRVPNVNVPRPSNATRDDIQNGTSIRNPVMTKPTTPVRRPTNTMDTNGARENVQRGNNGNVGTRPSSTTRPSDSSRPSRTTRPSSNDRPRTPSVTPRNPSGGGNSGRTGGSTRPSRSGGSSSGVSRGGSSGGSRGGGTSRGSGSTRNPR